VGEAVTNDDVTEGRRALIEVENGGPGVSVLRMAHGPVSAMDPEFLRAFRVILARTAATGDALVITGTGKTFCAGADLQRFADGGPDYVAELWPDLSGLFEDLLRYPRPVVAAINGHAIAGGCVIACCADYRLMAAGTIGVPELKVGLPLPAASLAAIVLTVGPGAAALINGGDTFEPEVAWRRGLVDQVVGPEDLRERAVAAAQRMAAAPAATFWNCKSALRRDVLNGLASPESVAADAEAHKIWASAEARQAVARYLEATLARKG
jgi:enoyl-CoA hydratase